MCIAYMCNKIYKTIILEAVRVAFILMIIKLICVLIFRYKLFYNLLSISQAPWWAFVLSAVGLFVYQSLDAIDGKQARRTKSASPLGELVDHGCDSVSMVIMILAICVAMQFGLEPAWMFFISFMATFMFYCAHWQAYVSGTIRFGK